MQTEREMVDRAINETKDALKRNLKYLIGFVILVIIIIWVIVKII